MPVSVSVIVCTHNPRRDYLDRALGALAAQSLPKPDWELLLVDNASQQRLADMYDIAWHERSRHVREDTLGLTSARLRGITEAVGELLVFVDDDNVLAPDFLERAQGIPRQYPHVTVFGSGTLEPEFEAEPPPELREYLHLLALRTVRSPCWSNNTRD